MQLSQLVLYEYSPEPAERARKSRKPSFRKSVEHKKQITNHLKSQKLGFCLNVLKQKTKLALRDRSKQSRNSSLTNRELLASRIQMEVDRYKAKTPSIKRSQPPKLLITKINVGDLAEVPIIPRQRPPKYMMSLTSRDFRQGNRAESPAFRFQRFPNNTTRLNQYNSNTLSTFSAYRVQNQRARYRVRKLSDVSPNFSLECLKL